MNVFVLRQGTNQVFLRLSISNLQPPDVVCLLNY